ncbi:hypothetical protein [Streptomyces minutiscleroticus]|uniref:hypothetical protein n=1 Tax=Streptomyces minutiscleroticus TaxID=68238 RepID=UPI0033349A3E
MSRHRTQPPAPYVVAELDGAHHVVDQRHGYALSSHTTRAAAEEIARELTGNPAAAIAAVQDLDAAQTGPAAAERRLLRRYGYAWSLRESDMLDLLGDFIYYYRLKELTTAGHLAVVFSPAGMPFYTTPEQFQRLAPRPVRDGKETFPAVDLARLERSRFALSAITQHKRYKPCELHGIALHRCMLCGPREQWECQRGACTANAVTTYCERRERGNPHRAFPMPSRPDED